ncbi:hypothetical protein NQD34_009125 [Periophthalmus magnuspinnatus]|nr:hypothetical protein NQD34_009125 [Periophthalmus magnuspinnatus]
MIASLLISLGPLNCVFPAFVGRSCSLLMLRFGETTSSRRHRTVHWSVCVFVCVYTCVCLCLCVGTCIQESNQNIRCPPPQGITMTTKAKNLLTTNQKSRFLFFGTCFGPRLKSSQ